MGVLEKSCRGSQMQGAAAPPRRGADGMEGGFQTCDIPVWAEQFLDGERPSDHKPTFVLCVSFLLPALTPPSFPTWVTHSTDIPQTPMRADRVRNTVRCPGGSRGHSKGRAGPDSKPWSSRDTGTRAPGENYNRGGQGPRGYSGGLPWEKT